MPNLDNLRQLPNPLRHSRSHRRGHPQRRMHAAEIVMREVQSASGFQVRQLLRESIRQPSKPPHLHSHSQILPLDMRRANMLRVRVACPHFGYDLDDWAWGTDFCYLSRLSAEKRLNNREGRGASSAHLSFALPSLHCA